MWYKETSAQLDCKPSIKACEWSLSGVEISAAWAENRVSGPTSIRRASRQWLWTSEWHRYNIIALSDSF